MKVMFMNSKLTISHLLTWRVRLFLYLSSLSSLLFMQNYCTNVCEFIDGLQPSEIVQNLGFIFILHIIYRELLYHYNAKSWQNTSLPRQAYYLSVISWLLAGVSALVLHAIKYPDFPFGSHLKLLSSYWVLGAGILSQLEYVIFEKRYKSVGKHSLLNTFQERISSRFIESFFIFSIAPTLTLLLVVGRYTFDGTIKDQHVITEILYLALFFVLIAIITASLLERC